MRYFKKIELVVSEDNVTSPKKIRFQDKIESEIDTTLIVDLDPHIETFGVGVFSINISSFTTVNWFYFTADKDITIKFNGNSTAIIFTADKENEMWAQITAIEITTTESTRITYVIGGV